MEFCALASGSSGNCFYIGDSKTAILVDVGISAKQVVTRMIKVGIDPLKVKAILVTHEHSDHINGVDVLARKLKIPIFATQKTIKSGFLCSDEELIKVVNSDSLLKIESLTAEAFSKSHGAADPISFKIIGTKNIAVITDLGYACKNTIKQVSDSDYIFLESNHDEEMLKNGPYLPHLKNLILSDKGHLSNTQAAICVKENAHDRLKAVILSHLSQVNNTPEMALNTFRKILSERKDFSPEIKLSGRYEPTELFRID